MIEKEKEVWKKDRNREFKMERRRAIHNRTLKSVEAAVTE